MDKQKQLDEIRRALITAGLNWEHAAVAVGFMADYAMTAYKEGYTSGFSDGDAWGSRKAPVKRGGVR
jgi:hypothetical protein